MQRCTALRGPVPGALARNRPSLRTRCKCEAPQAAAAPAAAPAPVAATSQTKQLRLRFGVKNIPHPSKASYGGEDAFFVLERGGGAMGIADGVGGWQESGINPADYSKSFMATARQFLEECTSLHPPQQPDQQAAAAADDAPVMSTGEWLASQPGQAPSPVVAALAATSSSNGSSPAAPAAAGAASPAAAATPPSPAAVARTALEALDVAHRSTQLPGSSTACVLRLDAARGLLDAANLGDSGFMIVRQGRLIFQSPVMQHFFDCPLQFGMPPDTDYSQDAAVFSLEVQPGDAIVLATDGLLDNMERDHIVALAPRSAEEVHQAAASMAEVASRNAADPTYESPYTKGALEEGIDLPIWEKLMTSSFKDGKFELGKLKGGKMDDITVLVGYVTEA